MVAFAEAIVGRDPQAIAASRQSLVVAAGSAVMVDAAGVASNFQRMVRIADATGIPLGEHLEVFSAEVRRELDLDRFSLRPSAVR